MKRKGFLGLGMVAALATATDASADFIAYIDAWFNPLGSNWWSWDAGGSGTPEVGANFTNYYGAYYNASGSLIDHEAHAHLEMQGSLRGAGLGTKIADSYTFFDRYNPSATGTITIQIEADYSYSIGVSSADDFYVDSADATIAIGWQGMYGEYFYDGVDVGLPLDTAGSLSNSGTLTGLVDVELGVPTSTNHIQFRTDVSTGGPNAWATASIGNVRMSVVPGHPSGVTDLRIWSEANNGYVLPAPASLALVGFGGLLATRRRRA